MAVVTVESPDMPRKWGQDKQTPISTSSTGKELPCRMNISTTHIAVCSWPLLEVTFRPFSM